MGYACYPVGDRFGGYGVPAICEHPDCNEEIDRGMPFACGGEPFSRFGCDRYFCRKHLKSKSFKDDGCECDCEDDCECESADLCERCSSNQKPFPYKPEHKKRIKHILEDSSWKERREKYPKKVKKYRKVLES